MNNTAPRPAPLTATERESAWEKVHLGECWILEQFSEETWYVSRSYPALYPIKRFRSSAKAIAWLDAQGATWQTAEQYLAIQAELSK